MNKITINICIPIETTEYLKEFIFKNINYRRKVYNDFVEEANKFKGNYNMYYGFDPWQFKKLYFKFEKDNDIYEDYCVGVSAQVSNDIKLAIKQIRDTNKQLLDSKSHNKKLGGLRFKCFDKYYGSFKVENKSYETTANNISNRIKVLDSNTLSFRIRDRSYINKEKITIHLKESLYESVCKYKNRKYKYFTRSYKIKGEYPVECLFNEKDIRETVFIHKLGKFYIQLSVDVRYFININSIKSRWPKAGIDTGIHNPLMLYNGYENTFPIKMKECVSKKNPLLRA